MDELPQQISAMQSLSFMCTVLRSRPGPAVVFFLRRENKDVVTGQNSLHLTESGRNHLVCSGWLVHSSRDSRRSTSDMALHLRYQAALTLPRSTLTSERDFAQARLQKKFFVCLQLRPRSPPSTRQFFPWSSGWVLSLCLRASSNAKPSVLSAFLRWIPFQCKPTPIWRRGHPKRDKPSAITSSLLPSVEACVRSKSKSRKKMFVETRAPPSRQTCATAFSTANPLRLKTPTVEHAAL